VNREGKIALGVFAAAMVVACGALGALAAAPGSASPYGKLASFARVLSHIERTYVEDVDGDALVTGAIKGMVRTLDPHSAYLTPEEFEIIQADTRGNFGGVGLEVGVKDDVMTVIAPIAGSPAERAGIEPGDEIVRISGTPTADMDLDEAVRLMRGEVGTGVTITVRRAGLKEPFDVTLVRAVIQVESVEGELVAPGFVRVWIRTFQDGASARVREEVSELALEGGGLDGIILDLRRNPGGLVEEAVRVSDLFLRGGLIVSTRGRDGELLGEFLAQRRKNDYDVPTVVLVDGGSASASEIVAGALQDQGRALVVGTRTFGKGSVQSLIPLSDGSGLKLTIALYFTPAGRSLQATGVIPDVLVESRRPPEPDEETKILDEALAEADLPGRLEAGKGANVEAAEPEIDDLQLRVAFHILRGLTRAQKARARAGKAE